MRVIVTPQARRQLDTALEWWLEHREKAPHAFSEDIECGFASIAALPSLGARIPEKPDVRRYFLRRIGYFVYYRLVDEGIEILAVWHHARGAGPSL